MTNVCGAQVMQALMKEPVLFYSVMQEIDMVLRMWEVQTNKHGSWLWRRFYTPEDGQHVPKLRAFEESEGVWVWDHLRPDGRRVDGEWGKAGSEEEACHLADEWARSKGYYLLEG